MPSRKTLLLRLLLAACAPTPREHHGLNPAPRRRPPIEEGIRSTQAGFSQAAEAGDARAMAVFFAADGMLISWAGDTILGRAAIEHYLATVRPDAAGATFRFARVPPLQPCADGAFEHGEYWVEVRSVVGAADTVVGRFTARWRSDSLGNVQVQWVLLASRTAPEVVRRPKRSECVDPAEALQRSTHFAVTLFQGASLGGPATALESIMTDRGWNDPTVGCQPVGGCAPGPSPRSERHTVRAIVPALAGFRYRFSDALASELVVGALPKGSTLGVDTTRGAEVDATWSGALAAAVLSYERGGLHVGAGPAVQHGSWRLEERPYPYTASVTYQATFRAHPAGLVADLGFHHPVLGRIRFEAHAQARRFAKTAIPGTPKFMPAEVDNNSSFVGFGLGLVF